MSLINSGREEELMKLLNIANTTPDKVIKGKELTMQNQIDIWNEIRNKFGNAKRFADEHGFNPATITYIVSTPRCKITKKAREICTLINYEL